MAEKINVPEIRFAGFIDPWEQRKFGELYRPVSEKNDMSFGRDRIISVANMYFNSVVYVTEDSYLANYNVMRLGDIAFEGNRSKRFAHGRFVENTIGDGIVSHVFKVFRPVGNNLDLSYWKHAINNEKLMKDVLTRSTKASTMMHELVSSDFLEESTLVPSLDEQRAIGTAIDSIDNLITLHQRKFEKLVQLKKSMLDKMFPKPGERFPEIRFAGFTDPWEQRKLGELTTILSAVRVHKEEWRTAGVPFYRSSDVMAAFKGTENERVFISQELFEQLSAQSGAPQKGDVMVTGGGSVGTPYIVPDNKPLYTKDADLIWIKRHTEINPKFLYSFFISPIFKSYIRSISHVGTIAHYTIEQVKETPLLMPCSIVEQKAIGSFLGNLDSLITLHQRKLELLRNTKKSLLDRMFV